MANDKKKDNFTDVVSTIPPKPTPPPPTTQVVANDGTVVTLGQNTKKPK